MSTKTAEGVLRKAEELLATARLGLEALEGDDPTRRPSGMHNVAVFGRSVTIVLQNLRSAVDRDAFEVWYAPHVERMKAEPVFRYFVDLRNEILKKGPPEMRTNTEVGFLNGRMLNELVRQAPPGAREMFIGDALGGSGFEVELPDGSIEKYYVALPRDWDVHVRLHVPAPSLDEPIATLSQTYLDGLGEIVADARRTFG